MPTEQIDLWDDFIVPCCQPGMMPESIWKKCLNIPLCIKLRVKCALLWGGKRERWARKGKAGGESFWLLWVARSLLYILLSSWCPLSCPTLNSPVQEDGGSSYFPCLRQTILYSSRKIRHMFFIVPSSWTWIQIIFTNSSYIILENIPGDLLLMAG